MGAPLPGEPSPWGTLSLVDPRPPASSLPRTRQLRPRPGHRVRLRQTEPQSAPPPRRGGHPAPTAPLPRGHPRVQRSPRPDTGRDFDTILYSLPTGSFFTTRPGPIAPPAPPPPGAGAGAVGRGWAALPPPPRGREGLAADFVRGLGGGLPGRGGCHGCSCPVPRLSALRRL